MNVANLAQYVVFLGILALLAKPLGIYLERVFEGQATWLSPLVVPLERALLKLMGVPSQEKAQSPGQKWERWAGEMTASTYALAFVAFSLVGTLLLYAILRLQFLLPGGPDAHFLATPMTPDLAFNTAISFSTTTTWQAYGGETTMRYLTQMVGLCAQNFLAAASGLAVGIAFIRGLTRRESPTIGNFWVDLTRAVLYVLLPLSIVGSLLLVWQGVPQNFAPYTQVTTLEGGSQILAQGPVAALEWIKNLGTNGGGFFNVNGAHPFENPTPLANLLEMLAIAVLPAALTVTFGRMAGDARQGWMLFGVMTALFVGGLALHHTFEQTPNPRIAALGVTGPNLEGKETRFGIGATTLTAITTSNGATGSYNAMHDSFSPLGGLVPLVNMLMGEVAYGGLGTGIYSLMMTVLIAVFLSGLMIGRTPEYLGKTLGPSELKMLMLYTLATPIAVLLPAALALTTAPGLAGLTTNDGAHGLSEIIYAFASCAANNGQNFAGLSANSPFYNVLTAISMMIGRFGLAIPALMLAGHVARQGRRAVGRVTLPTHDLQFGLVTFCTALLVSALSFLPALALGPIVEQFTLWGVAS